MSDIDSIIAEGVAASKAESAQLAAVADTTETVSDAVDDTPEADDNSEPSAAEKSDDPFPKKAVNTIARLKGDKYKLQAERDNLRREVERANSRLSALEKATPPAEPKREDYADDDVAYIKELTKWQASNQIQQTNKQSHEQQLNDKANEWRQARDAAIDDNAEQARESIPDFVAVLQKNEAALKGMAPHVHDAILEADNGAFALHYLAKEGLLASLNGMSPAKVAMTIARAEDKALALSKLKTVTNAPAPMTPVKGSAPGKKGLHAMDADELLAWVNSK